MSAHLLRILDTATTSADGLRPTAAHQWRQIGKQSRDFGAEGIERFMVRQVRTDTDTSNPGAAVQREVCPTLRKCVVDPRAELIELAADGLVTIARVMSELGWSESRASYWIEKLKASGELVKTGRGCRRSA